MKCDIIFKYLIVIVFSIFCHANGRSEKLYSDLRWEVNGIYYTTDVKVQSESEVTEVYVCNTEANPDEPGTSPKSRYSGDITIPSHIEISGKKVPVTKIATDAFFQSEVKTVVIPNTIEVIGSFSFASSEISSISFPPSVKKIYASAFNNTKLLKYVDIPATVEFVGNWAFHESGVKKVICLSPKVGFYTFRKCENLLSITLSDELKEIPDGLFMDCIKLKNIVIPDKVEKIGASSFFNTGGYTYGDQMPDDPSQIGLESIVLGKSVKKIDLYTFQITNVHKKFVCRSSSPPRVERCANSMSHPREGSPFTYTTLTECTLYVPEESLEEYKSPRFNEFSEFLNIIPMKTTATDELHETNHNVTVNGNTIIITAEDEKPIDIYSVDGVLRFHGNTPAEVELPSGMYIIRVDTRSSCIRL